MREDLGVFSRSFSLVPKYREPGTGHNNYSALVKDIIEHHVFLIFLFATVYKKGANRR